MKELIGTFECSLLLVLKAHAHLLPNLKEVEVKDWKVLIIKSIISLDGETKEVERMFSRTISESRRIEGFGTVMQNTHSEMFLDRDFNLTWDKDFGPLEKHEVYLLDAEGLKDEIFKEGGKFESPKNTQSRLMQEKLLSSIYKETLKDHEETIEDLKNEVDFLKKSLRSEKKKNSKVLKKKTDKKK